MCLSTIKSSLNLLRKKVKENTCEEKGFGIDGTTLEEAMDIYTKMKSYSKDFGAKKYFKRFEKMVKPVVDKLNTITKGTFKSGDINVAFGDFTLDDKKIENFPCSSFQFVGEKTKLGTLAIDLPTKVLPCAGQNRFSACVMFSRCGTFAVSFNNGFTSCVALATGIGATIAPFAKLLKATVFAYSHNNKIPLEVYINEYDGTKFKNKKAEINGNLLIKFVIDPTDAIFRGINN